MKTAEEGKEKRENLVLKKTFENSKRKRKKEAKNNRKTLCGGVYICGAPNWARARFFFFSVGGAWDGKTLFWGYGTAKKDWGDFLSVFLFERSRLLFFGVVGYSLGWY